MKVIKYHFRYYIFFICIITLSFTNNVCASNSNDDIKESVQDFHEYKGKVIDTNNKKPLIYADVTVLTTNISTVTNKEGEFSLKVPTKFSNASIAITFLGYKTLEVSLNSLKGNDNILKLTPTVTQLEQININAPKDAISLVKAALNKQSNSYIGDQTTMTAFYRETIKKRQKNASLAEAVVKIFKQPYSNNKRDGIELIKSRKSTNYSKLDTLALKLRGGPFSTLYSDLVKYPEYIFTEDTFPYYNFSFDQSNEINGHPVFVINFQQQHNVVTPLYSGKLYIDAKTSALVSAIYNLNVENKDETIKLFLRKKPPRVKVEPLKASYRVDYKTKDDKWFYSYSNIQLAFKVKWRKRLFGSTYTLNMEMAVTDWEADNTAQINKENRIKPSIILSDEASGFSDPEFWGDYNIIEPEKSIESAIKKIKKQLSKIDKKKK